MVQVSDCSTIQPYCFPIFQDPNNSLVFGATTSAIKKHATMLSGILLGVIIAKDTKLTNTLRQ